MRALVAYLKALTLPRIVLWCYLIWYLVMAGSYFDPSPQLWLTSAGLSLLIPFCVSSFAALVKDRGFVLIFSPRAAETGLALALCAVFLAVVLAARRLGVRALPEH